MCKAFTLQAVYTNTTLYRGQTPHTFFVAIQLVCPRHTTLSDDLQYKVPKQIDKGFYRTVCSVAVCNVLDPTLHICIFQI